MEFATFAGCRWLPIRNARIRGWPKPLTIVRLTDDGVFEQISNAALTQVVAGRRLPCRQKHVSCQTDVPSQLVPSAPEANHTAQAEVTEAPSPKVIKELFVTDEDIEILRNFFHTHNTNVDLDKFDNSAPYKEWILFLLQPVVQLERSDLNALKKEQARYNFARNLGLCARSSKGTKSLQRTGGGGRLLPATDAPASRSPRLAIPKSPGKRIRKAMPPRRPNNAPAPLRVNLSSNTKQYSAREDQSIIAWVSAAQTRERAVNGNRIWRELQGDFPNIAGTKRSWQSLRARYLRYLLSSLNSLALPPAHALRLRANAAKGELKWRKQRRNSVFVSRPVLSASARAPPQPQPPPEPLRPDELLSPAETVKAAPRRRRRQLYTAAPL